MDWKNKNKKGVVGKVKGMFLMEFIVLAKIYLEGKIGNLGNKKL
jgi:hypothetical protein